MAQTFNDAMENILHNVEEQVDCELEALENLKIEDLEEIRQRRLEALKKEAKQQEEWRKLGHGQYVELTGPKDFFEICKKSDNVIVNFYSDDSYKGFDFHFHKLAEKHLECKFAKINVEQAKFLVERFKITDPPTIFLIKGNVTIDRITGFKSIEKRNYFTYEMTEWYLAAKKMINADIDLSAPPEPNRKKQQNRRTIRGGNKDSDSSDED